MRNYGGLVHAVGGFARHRGGNFAILFSFAASVLVLAAGFSVNVAQLYNARSSLQGVVDAAVTSTARDLATGVIKEADANKAVQNFLVANNTAGILQPDQIVLDRLVVDRTAKRCRRMSMSMSPCSSRFSAWAIRSASPRRRHRFIRTRPSKWR